MLTNRRSIYRIFSRWRFISDVGGLSTLEYAVLFVVILVGGLTVWNALGSEMLTKVRGGHERFSAVLDGAQVSYTPLNDTRSNLGGGNSLPRRTTVGVTANNNKEFVEQEIDNTKGSKLVATPGKVIPGEPVTNPQVQEALREAYEDSHPVYKKNGSFKNREEENWPREQGLTGTTPGFIDKWILGNKFSLERWEEGDECSKKGCQATIPDNLKDGSLGDDLVFSAHIHPIENPEHTIGKKDYEQYIKYFSPTPHYIVAPEGVYRFTKDEKTGVKTEFIGTRQDVLY